MTLVFQGNEGNYVFLKIQFYHNSSRMDKNITGSLNNISFS